VKPRPITVGPLTGDEWASFALADDDRNPMPACCGNLSDVRDAIFDTLRAGGDPDLCWPRLASVWHLVEGHDGGDPDGPSGHPTMRKLYDAYVAGRKRPDRDEGYAHLLARKAVDVQPYVDAVPEVWDVTTREGRLRALARIGDTAGYILKPEERYLVAAHLARKIGVLEVDVCLVIDVLRLVNRLPYDTTHPDVRDVEEKLRASAPDAR
jgi:hypothetical protein